MSEPRFSKEGRSSVQHRYENVMDRLGKPMSASEMAGAIGRDSRDDVSVHPCAAAIYDRRGLLNVIDALLSSPETTPAPDAAIIADEIVAYYNLYDFHEVWKHSGARALVDWLITRGIIPASPETTPAGTSDQKTIVPALDAEIAVAKLRDRPGHDRRFWAGYAEGLGFGRELLAPSPPRQKPKRIDWSDVVVDEGDEAP